MEETNQHIATEVQKDPLSYGGFTRFELELEFVQTLSNPFYLNYLAVTKTLDDPAFIAYLDYLQYFAEPKYRKYLSYPAPTLRALQLLQVERFRKEILAPEVVSRLVEGGLEGWGVRLGG